MKERQYLIKFVDQNGEVQFVTVKDYTKEKAVRKLVGSMALHDSHFRSLPRIT